MTMIIKCRPASLHPHWARPVFPRTVQWKSLTCLRCRGGGDGNNNDDGDDEGIVHTVALRTLGGSASPPTNGAMLSI